MKIQGYLVRTANGKQTRRRFWDGKKPLDLDFPATYRLVRARDGSLKLRQLKRDQKKVTGFQDFAIPPNALDNGSKMRVRYPSAAGKERYLQLAIHKLSPLRPTYLPAAKSVSDKDNKRPGQFFLFWGTRYYLTDFQPLGQKFIGELAQKQVFKLNQKQEGFEIIALTRGVKVKTPGQRVELEPGKAVMIPNSTFRSGGIYWGKHWWRPNFVATPEKLPLDQMKVKEEKDKQLFTRLLTGVMGAFLFFSMIIKIIPLPENKPPENEPVTISLKAPKILAEKLPPKKKEPPKKIEKLKPLPKKPEPPKKIVKKKESAPKLVAKKPEPKKPEPKPVQVATKPPVQLPVEVKPDPAKEAAKVQAQLAQSLSFLSPGSAKPVTNIANSNARVNSKYNVVGNVDDLKKANANVLNNLAQVKHIDGPIETKNVRNVAANGPINEKALNEVQGKVSVGELLVADAGEFGSSISGSGLSVSGPGQLADSEIEKTLKKYLQKFQYCYEKELLSDNTLAGLIQMQWTISEEGASSDVKVLKSQLKKESLHNCLAKELGRIPFPTPKGGAVVIQYPFKFSSTSL